MGQTKPVGGTLGRTLDPTYMFHMAMNLTEARRAGGVSGAGPSKAIRLATLKQVIKRKTGSLNSRKLALLAALRLAVLEASHRP
jgi:hypothetical protein